MVVKKDPRTHVLTFLPHPSVNRIPNRHIQHVLYVSALLEGALSIDNLSLLNVFLNTFYAGKVASFGAYKLGS